MNATDWQQKLEAHAWLWPRPGTWFSWAELVRTRHLDKQTLPEMGGQRGLRHLVRLVLDPLREALGRPVHVNSGWRSDAVNEAVGGVSTSRHKRGQAADIKVRGMSARDVVRKMVELGLPFDKLIAYDDDLGGHVHVSFIVPADKNRGIIYICSRSESGGKSYRTWTP
jgi:zinc D-Ala-D-Ala carboxypeptidase